MSSNQMSLSQALDSLSLSHTHSHIHTHTHNTLSLTHTHTHSHIHTHTHNTLSHTHIHTISLSHTHSQILTHYLSHTWQQDCVHGFFSFHLWIIINLSSTQSWHILGNKCHIQVNSCFQWFYWYSLDFCCCCEGEVLKLVLVVKATFKLSRMQFAFSSILFL